MASIKNSFRNSTNRRAFLKTGIAASAATMGTGLLDGGLSAFGQESGDNNITKGDIAICSASILCSLYCGAYPDASSKSFRSRREIFNASETMERKSRLGALRPLSTKLR